MKFLARITHLFPIQKRGTIIVLEIPSDSINLVGIRIEAELELHKDGMFIGKFAVAGIDLKSSFTEPSTSLAILIRHEEESRSLIKIGLEVWQVEY
jgi:hypothetical protein